MLPLWEGLSTFLFAPLFTFGKKKRPGQGQNSGPGRPFQAGLTFPWVGLFVANQQALPHEPCLPQVPPAPVNKDDFSLVQRPGPGLSQESARRYGELTKLIRQQHEVRRVPGPAQWASLRVMAPNPPLTVSCSSDVPQPL